jgi:O-antigen ligase
MGGLYARTARDTSVSGFLFGLYIYFTIDFFIHFSARVPAYGVVRPTLLLTLFIGLMLLSQKEKFRGYADAPAFKAILLLIIFIIVSLPFVTWPGSIIKNNLPEFVKAISFFFFTALILDSEKRLRIFLLVFVVCQLFRVLEPLYLHVVNGYWGTMTYIGAGEFTGRLSGAPADVINPNELGFVIATLFPFLYYLAWGSPGAKGKIAFVVFAPLLVYALVLTMSRSAFVAMCVVVWMILKESRNKFGMLVLLIAAALVVWSQLSPLQKDRYLSIVSSGTSQSGTAQGRIDGMWREFRLGLRRPVFGHGVGTTPEAKYHAYGKQKAAHNLYAELMIEAGIIGLFIFLRYLSAIYKSFNDNREAMKSVHRDAKSDFQYRLNQTMITVFWMYAVFSLSYWGLSNYYWYMFGGLTVAFSRIYFSEIERSLPERVGSTDHDGRIQ